MNFPSIKTLQRIDGVDKEKAKSIRAVLESTKRETITEKYKSARDYVNACYNPPSFHMVKLYAINEIIEGHGIEAIDLPEGSFSNCQEPDICVDYINLGDTYATTLCRVSGRKANVSYRVTDWGSIVERYDS